LPSVCAIITARVRSLRASSAARRRSVRAQLDVENTGHEPVLEDRVDRRREAGAHRDDLVARRSRSSSVGEVSVTSRDQVREEPEVDQRRARTRTRRETRLDCDAKRTVVSQKSSPASTRCCTSVAPNTLPDTGPASRRLERPAGNASA
jgi:hypothetical protein